MKLIWRDYKTPPNRQENTCAMYVRLGTIHLWLSTNRLRIKSRHDASYLSHELSTPNLHEHNYENHCMNMYLELQKLNTYT